MREGTFVLVHGAWHGAWCWERLVPELEAHGHTTIEVDLPAEDPEAGLTRYAELTAAAMGDADDVVVVGHSLGAATIPLVASLRPVRHLVFLCGLVPEPGRSVTDRYGEDVFVPGFVGNTAHARGRRLVLAGPVRREALLLPRLLGRRRRMGGEPLPRAVGGATARAVAGGAASPTSSARPILCRDERCIRPDWSRRVSRELLGVEPLELGGGHSPFVSRPAELAELLVRLA